ncbi:energy-coupling factor transporter transmembrane component T family protein [Pseudonocardia kunmingensis]|uniref:Energy-coupling factor transport system permease protein n=1 Tax=Pseudonocardia kunmingensis TaxID=630975 RepID=A0A543DQU7_9PSEU|nr:energy-coupling factor transporter transmembrane component T [Pseudonocardia kunmingensis]TQM11696.1 energy-coupling factor transport system permease protein [Pseudonocardia kunmingensis]
MSGGMLYRPGASVLHRADPRAKMIAILVVLVSVLSTTRLDVLGVMLVVVVAALHVLAGLTVRSYWKALVVTVPLMVLLTLLQAVVQEGPVAATVAGVELSQRGLLLGAGLALRLLTMGIAFYGFAATTSPSGIALAVHKAGVPYKFAYLTSFAFRFLPLIQDEARTLLTAMSVRGAADASSRNPVARGKALVRMVFPMFLGALRRSGDIALSMELRGYGLQTRRTFVHELRMGRSDVVLVAATLALGLAMAAVRLSGFSVLPWEA